MRTIFKYQLEVADRQTIELPKGAQPVSVQLQNGKLCLWALIDTDADVARYKVEMYGTGKEVCEMPVGYDFLGTLQVFDGVLVYHLFGYFIV